MYWPVGLVGRVFTNGPGDRGSIPGRIITKIQTVIIDISLLNTQHKKVRIKGKWFNLGKGVAPSRHLSVVAIKKGAFGSPSTMVANFAYIYNAKYIN